LKLLKWCNLFHHMIEHLNNRVHRKEERTKETSSVHAMSSCQMGSAQIYYMCNDHQTQCEKYNLRSIPDWSHQAS
jgi:hypothetical protein